MLAYDKNHRGKQIDNLQIFAIIDNILPFEACLYYQIIPWSVEGSRVRLGIVDSQDFSALDYARRLLSYLNCSLVTEEISSEFQRSILSSYLNYIGHKKSNGSTTSQINLAQKNQKQTENYEYAKVKEKQQSSEPKNTTNQGCVINNSQNQSRTKSLSKNLPSDILELSLPSCDQFTSLEYLASLELQDLLKELLARVFKSGICRLYFEQQKSQGRILLSLDGVLKSVLENLEQNKIEGIINELKILTKMPLIPMKKHGKPKWKEYIKTSIYCCVCEWCLGFMEKKPHYKY